MAGAAAIVRVIDELVAVRGVGVPESVTLRVTVKVPAQAALGVPVMVAPDDELVRVRQGGSVPLARLQV
jgi:hypothetical protein